MKIGTILEYMLASFVGLAIISVIVSRQSTTTGVLQAFGAALANILGAIVAPISTGAATAAANSSTANSSTVASSVAAVTAPVSTAAPASVSVSSAAVGSSGTPNT